MVALSERHGWTYFVRPEIFTDLSSSVGDTTCIVECTVAGSGDVYGLLGRVESVSFVRVSQCPDRAIFGRPAPPPKNWRWWHAFGCHVAYRAPCALERRITSRPRRRQHPFPIVEAAALKRRRFLQKIRVMEFPR
jgi:hypothetical protein